jgi:glycerate kinase
VTPSTVLVAAEAFGGKLDGARAARAIGRGLREGSPELEVDLCPIGALPADLDARVRRARAVVIAAERLSHETLLRGDAVFEIATRARQAGVPCCAVAGRDDLDLFEKRILDLQVVMEAAAERSLTAAAKILAASIL